MAQKTLQANFKRFLTQNYKKIGYLAGLGDSVVFDLELGGQEFIDGVRKGMKPILKANNLGDVANEAKVWKDVVKRTTDEINKTQQLHKVKLNVWSNNTKNPGIYLVKSKGSKSKIHIRLLRQKQKSGKYITGDNRVAQIATAYRDIAYNMWLKVVEENIKKDTAIQGAWWTDVEGRSFSEKIKYESAKRGSTEKTVQSIIAQNTNVAHRKGTTRADLAMKALKESNPSLSSSLNISVFDILKYAEENLDVTFYKNDKKKKVGSYTFNTLIEARLAYNAAGSEDSDKRATVNKFESAVQMFIEDALTDKTNKFHKSLVGIDTVASKTPKKRIIDDVVEDLIKPLTKKGLPDRRFKVNRKGRKQPAFKNQARTIKAKKGKKTAATTRMTKTVNVAGAVGRPEKSKRKGQQSLHALEALINKRLPAEVRRNMGRPALENRSGTFSNSVELLKLHRAKTGLTGDYTYMKTGGGTPPRSGQPGVYQTFENGGRWSSGYNPKDLITKSIRNLALQYTKERFVQLRRQ